MGKILRISLKLNFFPNTLDCYGLTAQKLPEEWGNLATGPEHQWTTA